MQNLSFIRKGILALLVGATTLVACSKDSDNPEVPKGNYGVFIGGVELTSENYQNINSTNFPDLKSGTVTYDPIKRVLTLDGVTVEATGKDVAAIKQLEGTTATLTIVLKNNNTLSSEKHFSIYVEDANLRITGDKGFLKIAHKKEYNSIYAKKDLTLEGGCSIVVNDQIRVKNTLTINKANVHVKEDGYPAFFVLGEINLIDCKVVTPEGAKKGKLKNSSGIYYNTFVKDHRFCKEVKIEISE